MATKRSYSRLMCLAGFLWWAIFSHAQTPEFIILQANTPVMVTLETEIDAESVVDRQVIRFTVEQSVTVDFEKLILVKAAAYGYVKNNDGDVLEVEMTGVQAVDDTTVPLRGMLRKPRACRRCTISIKNGTTIEALVRENVKIKLKKG